MKDKKNKRVWLWTRIAFYAFIIIWILLMIFDKPDVLVTIISYLIIASAISTFVLSIIHLRKYKQKGFAITALVISSLWILIIFISIIYGILLGLIGSPQV